jgi:hypothetical protein
VVVRRLNAVFDPDEMLAVLSDHKVEFVLIGGMAAALHGSDVVTFDLDVTPRTAQENLERLAAALRDLDARLRAASEATGVSFDVHAESLEGSQVLNLVTRVGDLDVVMRPAGSSGFEDLERNALEISIGGVSTLVASLSDVIRSKEAANREKDRAVLPALKRLETRISQEEPFERVPIGTLDTTRVATAYRTEVATEDEEESVE